MRARTALLLVALTGLIAPPATAQQEPLETGGLIGLTLPLGARNVGMGRAASAALGEIQALPYNPAVLEGVGRGALAYSRFESADAADVNSNYLAGAARGAWGALAAQIVYLDFGEIPVTIDSPDPEGTIDVSETVVGVTYANRWRERLAYGATAKWYVSDLGETEGSGPAFDLGLVYSPRPGLPFELAVALLNLGPDLEYDPIDGSDDPVEGQRLPGRVRVGARWHPADVVQIGTDARFELAFDVESDLEELSTSSLHGGAAVVLSDLVALRGGFLILDNPFVESGDGDRNVGGAFGIGISSGGFVADVSREVSVSELGDETHFSVGYRF